VVAVLWLPSGGTALAHTGEPGLAWAAGFRHPWSGLDHLLVMLAVGVWAGLKGGRALWLWPALFVAVMLIGGIMGFAHIPLPMVEPAILASLVGLGGLLLAAVDVPVGVGAALIAAAALLHGHAHGSELPAEAAALNFAAGFAVATALLHAFGLGVATLCAGDRGRLIVRGAGGGMVVAGLMLAFI
jgi:urease accessory protein